MDTLEIQEIYKIREITCFCPQCWPSRTQTGGSRELGTGGLAGKLEGSSDTRCREEPTMAASWWERGAVSSTGGSGRRQSEGCSQELARLRCWGGMGLIVYSVQCTVFSLQFTTLYHSVG